MNRDERRRAREERRLQRASDRVRKYRGIAMASIEKMFESAEDYCFYDFRDEKNSHYGDSLFEVNEGAKGLLRRMQDAYRAKIVG